MPAPGGSKGFASHLSDQDSAVRIDFLIVLRRAGREVHARNWVQFQAAMKLRKSAQPTHQSVGL